MKIEKSGEFTVEAVSQSAESRPDYSGANVGQKNGSVVAGQVARYSRITSGQRSNQKAAGYCLLADVN